MKRGLAGLTIFMFIIGILAAYLGLGIIGTGNRVSGTGGAFGNELSVLGGLWSALGAVLALLGILCFPMGLGFITMREWGRKNGVFVVFLISAVSLVAGFLVAYFDIMGSIVYFILTVLAIICGQFLRERKTLFELGTGAHKGMGPAPTYREVRHVRQKVIMRQSRDAPRIEHRPMVKCERCGTMNDYDRTHCKMCGREL